MRCVALCALLCACAGDAAGPDDTPSVVLVTLRPGAQKPSFAAMADGVHVELRRSFASFPVATMRVDAEGYRALLARPDVVAVEPDRPVKAHLVQSVPLIRADVTRADGAEGAGVAVAVLDTGVNFTHEDLKDAILGPGQRFLGDEVGTADDDNGHGSNVAGVIASSGAWGGTGVAPGARIVPVKVLAADASGVASDWVAALDWVIDNRNAFEVPIRVVNMSLGTNDLSTSCPCDDDPNAGAMASALAAARAAGLLVVASSGNDGDTQSLPFPACLSTALPVAATYDADFGPDSTFGCTDQTAPMRFSCFSDRNACVSLVAPGAAITTAYRGSDTATATFIGTSQAAPHVAGVAAIIWGKFPSLTVDQVAASLLTSTRTVNDPVLPRSYAFLDAVDALAAAECNAGCAPEGVCDQAVCDASETCRHAPKKQGALCGDLSCTGATLSAPTCNAAGECAVVTQACGNYRCNAAGTDCRHTCAVSSDCAEGFQCEGSACVSGSPGGVDGGPGAEGGGGGCQAAPGPTGPGTLLGLLILLRRLRWTRSSRRSSVPAVRNRSRCG